MMKNIFLFLLFLMSVSIRMNAQDWANLSRYQKDNAELLSALPDNNRVVFMGNSIIELWKNVHPDFFIKDYINRGISGQTTPQMLIRFKQDVIALKPKVVVILGGTNDIAGNTGPSTLQMIQDNLSSMAEIATANHLKVIMCSVLPAYEYPWKSGIDPREKIQTLNTWIKEYAELHGHCYVDFYPKLVNTFNGLMPEYTSDGVHPNLEGYKVMEPLLINAIKKVLGTMETGHQSSFIDKVDIINDKDGIIVKSSYNTTVDIFTLAGSLLKSTTVVKGVSHFSMHKGVYLVKAGDTFSKVIIGK